MCASSWRALTAPAVLDGGQCRQNAPQRRQEKPPPPRCAPLPPPPLWPNCGHPGGCSRIPRSTLGTDGVHSHRPGLAVRRTGGPKCCPPACCPPVPPGPPSGAATPRDPQEAASPRRCAPARALGVPQLASRSCSLLTACTPFLSRLQHRTPPQQQPQQWGPRNGEQHVPPLAASPPAGADLAPRSPPLRPHTDRVQKTIELPPLSRGCHVVTRQILEALPELAEFEGGRPGRAGDAAAVIRGGGRWPQLRAPAACLPLTTRRLSGPSPPAPAVGLVNLLVQHTSASLTINENASPGAPLGRAPGHMRGVALVWGRTTACRVLPSADNSRRLDLPPRPALMGRPSLPPHPHTPHCRRAAGPGRRAGRAGARGHPAQVPSR